MAQVTTTPFASSATSQAIALPKSMRMILRCDAGSVKVVIAVGRTTTASDADYFLSGGDAVEIKNGLQDTTVNVLAITGTPNIYWRLEPLTPWN